MKGFLFCLLGLTMFVGAIAFSIYGPDLTDGQEFAVVVLGVGGMLTFFFGLDQADTDKADS